MREVINFDKKSRYFCTRSSGQQVVWLFVQFVQFIKLNDKYFRKHTIKWTIREWIEITYL